MGDLTKNFSKWEFKCKCGCGKDDINIELVNQLQKLRDNINKPIHINSGVRCLTHNRSIGSKDTSQHVKGNATDIVVTGLSIDELAEEVKRIPMFFNGGIIIYNTFIHVDIRKYKYFKDNRTK
jgi:uncharacterized protein YcbK (DUF882 family)